MTRFPTILLAVLLVVTALPAQQSGTANRDYVINNNGSYMPSFVNSQLCVPYDQLNQSYTTLDPLAPVIWAAAPVGTVGWFLTPTNSVDIGPAGLTFLLDGTFLTSSSPINYFAVTDQYGSFYLSLPTSPGLSGQSIYLAMAHAAATSPDGMWVSQTHHVSFTSPVSLVTLPATSGQAANPAATALALSDDSYQLVPLNGSGFSWYGTAYTECYVGSNGFVTFGQGDSSTYGDPFWFSSGPPRIATCWRDLNPATGGTVKFFADPTGGFEVTFTGVPEYYNTGANTFRLIALAGLYLQMDYAASMTLTDGFVGVSPGNNGTVNPADLSAPPPGGNPIPLGTGIFESFNQGGCSPANDLKGYTVTFLLDAQGRPLTQF